MCMVLLDQFRQSWDGCQRNICISRTISFCHPCSVSAKRIQNHTDSQHVPTGPGRPILDACRGDNRHPTEVMAGQCGRPICSPEASSGAFHDDPSEKRSQQFGRTLMPIAHISCSSRETNHFRFKMIPESSSYTDTSRLLQVGFQNMCPNSIVQLTWLSDVRLLVYQRVTSIHTYLTR